MTTPITKPSASRVTVPTMPQFVGGYLNNLAAIVVEEFTTPTAVSTNAIKTAVATVAAATTYSGAALTGAIGGGEISPPRNITVTTAGATTTDAPATATITGTDIDGNAITEDISPSTSAATVVGAKAFASVTSIALTAAGGTGATLAFGIGGKIGLAKKAKTRAGVLNWLGEIAAGAKATNGTFVVAATGLPNGTYAPNSAPDGSRSYAITYEAETA